jgi:hypothetical protein
MVPPIFPGSRPPPGTMAHWRAAVASEPRDKYAPRGEPISVVAMPPWQLGIIPT